MPLVFETQHPFPTPTATVLLKSRVSSDVLANRVHVYFEKARESGVELIGLNLTKDMFNSQDLRIIIKCFVTPLDSKIEKKKKPAKK